MRHLRVFRIAACLGLAACVAPAGAAPPPPPAPGAVRIMPLGDSITQGNREHPSYRRPLWQKLTAAGYSVDFVGSLRENFQGPNPNDDFDLDHEGHWGWKVSDILAKLDGWLAQNTPDVILVHLGTNDANARKPEEILNDLEAIVDLARKHNPKVKVLMAQLMTPWGAIPRVNAEIPKLAQRKSTPASPVIAVDQSAGFEARKDRDTYDGCHPNASGEEKMAARWFEALRKVLPPPKARAR